MKKEFKDCLTSELLFHALKERDEKEKRKYFYEYLKRLKGIGLADCQIADVRFTDEAAILGGCYIKRKTLLASVPFIKDTMSTSSIVLKHCTFSELIYLAYDANVVYANNFSWFPSKAWKLTCLHADIPGGRKSTSKFQTKMKAAGLLENQILDFEKHELAIINRLRQW